MIQLLFTTNLNPGFAGDFIFLFLQLYFIRMINFIKRIGFIAFLFYCTAVQSQAYVTSIAHSHNDYLNVKPFTRAYEAGFGSIEADIFPINDTLYVAHSKKEIQAKRTLKSLYLDPLYNDLTINSSRHVKLLIDIKENYALSLQLLEKELEPFKPYLYSSEDTSRPLLILVSGNRPPPAEYQKYPDYIFFDDDLKLHHTAAEWQRVGQVSLSFENFSSWKGKGRLNTKDKKLLKHLIDSVHLAGKPIRFWAAPDTKTSWKIQMKLGADLIGTDKINELAGFLRKQNK
jgi:alkaline phosphatase